MILTMLVEGVSMRSSSRIAGVSINTIVKLLTEAGARPRLGPPHQAGA
ncbi:hypothetical protein [Sphingomonas bacterium]|nr:hypothetical protein [Sphingomonas bacterium]